MRFFTHPITVLASAFLGAAGCTAVVTTPPPSSHTHAGAGGVTTVSSSGWSAGGASAGGASSGAPIGLISANVETDISAGAGYPGYSLSVEGLAEVEKVGQVRALRVKHTDTNHGYQGGKVPPDVSSDEVLGTYVGDVGGNRERWSFTLWPPLNAIQPAVIDVRFSLEVDVDGVQYAKYDNDGQGYCVGNRASSCGYAVLGSSMVDLMWAATTTQFCSDFGGAFTGDLCGQVLVRDLGQEQVVRVLYSTDGWATQSSIDAGLEGTEGLGTQRWMFNADLSDIEGIQIVIQLEAKGATYLDDNQGKTYTLEHHAWLCPDYW